MAFVKTTKDRKIGDWGTTKRVVESCAGYFEVGTKVQIIGIGTRGYDLQDEFGNRILETGFDVLE